MPNSVCDEKVDMPQSCVQTIGYQCGMNLVLVDFDICLNQKYVMLREFKG